VDIYVQNLGRNPRYVVFSFAAPAVANLL